MGKKLIIKGADFSVNKIDLPFEVDLTGLFTFTSGTYAIGGGATSSASFKKSNTIDVSDYVGKTMNVSFCSYKSSAGERPGYYGLFFYDADNQVISNQQVYLGTDGNGSGRSVDMNIIIPDNAVGFKTTYLAEEAFADEATPFYCIIHD
jgi:hypothetical protein